jgi:excisionase family DNA binding protein
MRERRQNYFRDVGVRVFGARFDVGVLIRNDYPISMSVCIFRNIAMSESNLEFLTVGDLAPWLRLQRSTLYSWAATGKIPCVKLNGTIRFIRADIERWIQDHAHQAADVPPSIAKVLPHTSAPVSRVMLKQAGTRIIQRAKDRQATGGTSNPMPPRLNRKRIA